MNSSSFSYSIEDRLRAATRMPQPRREFLDGLRARLVEVPRLSTETARRPRVSFQQPAWVYSLVAVLAITVAILAIGPQRVLAAVRHLWGYIPGVGIVDQSAPIRVLAEPVRITRDGITISVNQATLTADQTHIEYGISGVPLSAYPKDETVLGCAESGYLRLPDGTQVDLNAPIPADVNAATLVIPCIFNTLPGSVPLDWELSMRFVPAPPDMTVLPVIYLTPSPHVDVSAPGVPVTDQMPWISIDQVIETQDGYVLIGTFRPQISNGGWAQVSGVPQIRDGAGSKVEYTIPQDVQHVNTGDLNNGGFQFAYQVKAAGLAFPLTISFPGEIYSPAEPAATAEIDFDAGPDPRPGQVWELNQDIHLGAYTTHLISVTAQEDGYYFQVRSDDRVSPPSIQIEGYPATGGSGGGGGISLAFAELPKGKLKLIFSDLFVVTDTTVWEVSWQPEMIRTDWPTPASGQDRVCVGTKAIDQLGPLPAGLQGQVLLTGLNPNIRIILAWLDGTQGLVVPNASRGTLSPDGKFLAYPGSEGITILNLTTQATSVLPIAGARDLHWSPDGKSIAFVTVGDSYGVLVASLDGKSRRQYSNLGYESIAGWSSDGNQLYYAIPDAGGTGWLLKSVAIVSGDTKSLFVLENASGKAPLPTLSPDGNWVVYRGRDNGSLYMIRMDGTQSRLVVANPSESNAITGIAWDQSGSWLGISILQSGVQDGDVLLLNPQSCVTYRLSSLQGELDGLRIP